MSRHWPMKHSTARCTPNANKKSQSLRTSSSGGVHAHSVSTAARPTCKGFRAMCQLIGILLCAIGVALAYSGRRRPRR